MDKLIYLYHHVLSNYNNCYIDTRYLSDTWSHTLEQKGRIYSFSEMLHMRARGNKVNSWMVDSSYLIDSTVLDLYNPYVTHLLQLGESDFGSPCKDINVRGRYYSSLFLRDVCTAVEVVQRIEDTGITSPTIMEIGGGVGILQYLLKGYFEDRLTLFAVDIPETLLIQEWYLRNCFPEVDCSYKSSHEYIHFVEGGINFINAYVLQAQDIPFDVVININSMQEMTADTAHTYIRYIERNIAKNGFFFFQNHHGHSATSAAEPSEYDLDANWTIESVDLVCQIDTCSEAEMARIVFRRTHDQEDVSIRKVILRLIWNGLISGLLEHRDVIQELARIPKASAESDPILIIEESLKKHHVVIPKVTHLQNNVHFPHDFYLNTYGTQRIRTSAGSVKTHLMDAIRTAQIQLISLMSKMANHSQLPSIQSTQALVAKICFDLLDAVGEPIRSEYWNAYLAGILFPLGQGNEACSLLKWCASWSGHTQWLIRFACLLSRYGYLKDTKDILAKLSESTDRDIFLSLKCVELEFLCGLGDQTRFTAENLVDICKSDLVTGAILAKAAARIGAEDIVLEICNSLKENFSESANRVLLDILSFATSMLPREKAVVLVQHVTETLTPHSESPDIQMSYGVLMWRLGEGHIGLPFVQQSVNSFSTNYYKLGWAGKILQEAGFNKLADDCLSQSVRLRPENFMHHEFVGNVYLFSERFGKALGHFIQAVNLKPCLRHLRARAAYCALPNKVRDTGIFGKSSDLEIIFQRTQNFYQVGPSWK